ncbi:MAG TPA: hypothetical protein VIC85_08885 [Ktedonobacterales bacterium]|jgi:hypothetical protein
MSPNVRVRPQNHWSLRLQIKRPGGPGRTALIVLGLAQALMLYFTASSFATTGGLYGCSTACAPAGVNTARPLASVVFAILILILPAIMGALSTSWPEAVMVSAIPWLLAVIFLAATLLAPTYRVIGAATSQFGAPFWLDAGRLMPLLLSLAFFVGLGWLGYTSRMAMLEA